MRAGTPSAEALCVYCHKQPAEPAWKPFCSERCRLLDLAKWLDGGYHVPGAAAPTSAPEDSDDPSD